MGWGVNDASYKVQPTVDGKKEMCPYYDKWYGMLRRAYNLKYKTKNKSYKDVTICEDWMYFSNFKEWMETKNFKGLELDKDILVPGNKEYSPSTCVFVPSKLNKSLNTKVSLTGRDCPLGVYRIGDKFRASISLEDGARLYLGNHSSKVEAHRAWQAAKARQIQSLIIWYAEQDSFLIDVAESLHMRVYNLLSDLENSSETTRECF